MPRLPLLAGLAVTLAACGSSTAPRAVPKLADAAATAAQLQSIAAPGTTNLLLSFAVLATKFGPALGGLSGPMLPSSMLVLSPPSPRQWRGGQGVRTTLWRGGQGVRTTDVERGNERRVSVRTGEVMAALLPDTLLGKTFTWDLATQKYVASTLPGAPANGVRFEIYQVTLPDGAVLSPLEPLGYVDLSDQSGAGNRTLGVTIVNTVAAPVTDAQYTISAPAGGVASTTTVAGFVSDGTTRLDLNSVLTLGVAGVTSHTTLTIAAQNVGVDETVTITGTGTHATIAIDFALTHLAETVRENGAITVDTASHSVSGDLAVTVNNQPFADIILSISGLNFTGASGVQLTPGDDGALHELYSASAEVFATVLLLSAPGLGLGV